MAKAYDHLFKLLLIGDSGVGKTCLIIRFAEDNFTSTYISTIGIDFKIRTVDIDGKKIKLQVWDTAGQERFKTITTAYYRGAVGIILVYDITDEKSFENIQNWMKSIKENASAGVERLLIGNKCDMEGKRKVQRDAAEKLAKEHGIRFFETSAKSSVNVEEAFSTLARDILQKSSRKMAPSSSRPLLEPSPPRKAGAPCLSVKPRLRTKLRPSLSPPFPSSPASPSGTRASRWRRCQRRRARPGSSAAVMGPRGPVGPRCCGLCAVLVALICGVRPAAAAMVASDERRSASPVAVTPCWRVEDFVVAQECTRCSSFQAKTIPECNPTGFIEKINCATSKRDEFKSCRSAVMEAHVFWRFVGTMMCVAAVFAVLVVCRQRVLDRKALEKVRKQIESI